MAQKDGGDPYVVEVAMSPKVAFKDGKATEATINWGEASAPLLIYPLVYASTGLDNSTNFLGPQVVKMVNEFTGKKCAEVKAELPSNNAELNGARLVGDTPIEAALAFSAQSRSVALRDALPALPALSQPSHFGLIKTRHKGTARNAIDGSATLGGGNDGND